LETLDFLLDCPVIVFYNLGRCQRDKRARVTTRAVEGWGECGGNGRQGDSVGGVGSVGLLISSREGMNIIQIQGKLCVFV
jgi:hypothetical protein